jgi:hypothetical protein
MIQDLRYGARMLRRNAGFTVVAILALALGIGVNTAVFTANKAMIARPLDARNPGEMVNIALMRDSGAADYQFSYPDYETYRDSLHSCSGLIAYQMTQMTLNQTENANVFVVSDNYFKVLQVAALQGRTFDSIGAPEMLATPPVLISENYWQRRFAGDRAMIGKTVYLSGLAVTVVGITPHDFAGTSVGAPAFWVPLTIEPLIHGDDQWLKNRENLRYRLFGRLAHGATIAHAQAEMNPIADHLRTLHDPHSDSAKPAQVLVWPGSPFPMPMKQFPGLQLSIVLIMASAGMVLFVACANVGSLQLARARSRQDELRTRLALGPAGFGSSARWQPKVA